MVEKGVFLGFATLVIGSIAKISNILEQIQTKMKALQRIVQQLNQPKIINNKMPPQQPKMTT